MVRPFTGSVIIDMFVFKSTIFVICFLSVLSLILLSIFLLPFESICNFYMILFYFLCLFINHHSLFWCYFCICILFIVYILTPHSVVTTIVHHFTYSIICSQEYTSVYPFQPLYYSSHTFYFNRCYEPYNTLPFFFPVCKQ